MHHEKRSSSRLPLDARRAHWRWESSSRLLGCMLIKTNRFRFCCPSRDATPLGLDVFCCPSRLLRAGVQAYVQGRNHFAMTSVSEASMPILEWAEKRVVALRRAQHIRSEQQGLGVLGLQHALLGGLHQGLARRSLRLHPRNSSGPRTSRPNSWAHILLKSFWSSPLADLIGRASVSTDPCKHKLMRRRVCVHTLKPSSLSRRRAPRSSSRRAMRVSRSSSRNVRA